MWPVKTFAEQQCNMGIYIQYTDPLKRNGLYKLGLLNYCSNLQTNQSLWLCYCRSQVNILFGVWEWAEVQTGLRLVVY